MVAASADYCKLPKQCYNFLASSAPGYSSDTVQNCGAGGCKFPILEDCPDTVTCIMCMTTALGAQPSLEERAGVVKGLKNC